jgi:hypothetical protein
MSAEPNLYIECAKMLDAEKARRNRKAAKLIGCDAGLAANVKMKKAIREAMAEIRYQHKDMLTAHERNHPRGSGWARVYDRLKQSISS